MFDAFSALHTDTDSRVSLFTNDHMSLFKLYIEGPSTPPAGVEDPYGKLVSTYKQHPLFSLLETATIEQLSGMEDGNKMYVMHANKEDVYNNTDLHTKINREDLPTVISIAAYLGKAELLKLLLFAYETAKPNQNDRIEWKALGLAAYAGHGKCIHILAAFHQRLESKNQGSFIDNTLIYPYLRDGVFGAIYFDRTDSLQVIMDMVSLNIDDNIFRLIVDTSIIQKAFELKRYNVAIKLLSGYWETVRKARTFDYASFFNMYFGCENAVMRSLLVNSARSVISPDQAANGFNLLHYLCLNHRDKSGFEDLLIELLKIGVRLDSVDKDGATPLECLPQDMMVNVLRRIPESLRSTIPSHLLRYMENDTASSAEAPAASSTTAALSSTTVPSAATAVASSSAMAASAAAAAPASVGGWFYSVLGTARRISDRIDRVNDYEAPAPQRTTGHR